MNLDNDKFCCGLSRIDITPAIGLDLSGGAFGPSKGILHALSAKALYIERLDRKLLLISADLVGFDTVYAQQIQQTISQKYNIPLTSIMLTATHTHAGPATVHFRNWGKVDDSYCRELKNKLEQLVGNAISSSTPARIGSGYIDCPGVATNRVMEDGPVDNQLGVIRIENMQGQILAIVLNYACHAVNLHSYHNLISADFPYYIELEIQHRLGHGVSVFYLAEAGGDLNPKNFIFLKPSEQAAQETGHKLAKRALELLPSIPMEENPILDWDTIEAHLPLQPLPAKFELLALIDQFRSLVKKKPDKATSNWKYCLNKTQLEWAQDALKEVEANTTKTVETITLSVLRIGNSVILGIPGELFTEFGIRIKSAAIFSFTALATFANGYAGYFPNRQAFEINHYEAIECPKYCGIYLFQPHVGEVVSEAALTLLRRIKSRKN
ncbi:MAG: hypothetical protein WC975_00805 [Phycisphaerae bacterium]